MPSKSSTSTSVQLVASALTVTTVAVTWRLLQWRARKRATEAAERVQYMIKPGPLINAEDTQICEAIVNKAIRRASKWISFQLSANDGSVMIGQVGGVSVHKRPLLTLEPDYVMKPVQTDHRGIREIFLYEAVNCCRDNNRNSQNYSNLLTGIGHGTSSCSSITNTSTTANAQRSSLQYPRQLIHRLICRPQQLLQKMASVVGNAWDTLAMWMAMTTNDPIVAQKEQIIKKSWKVLKKEVDTLRRLATFTAAYYGVVGQRSPLSMPHGEERAHKEAAAEEVDAGMNNGHERAATLETRYGVSLEAHLLLTDATANFKKPCVMDLKMGQQSYEPDAPAAKKERESAKYPQQEQFGFRIVGMRFYDPEHPEADTTGYRYFPKVYGRSLATIEDVVDAMRLFFSAGCAKKLPEEVEDDTSGEDEDQPSEATAPTSNGSSDETLSTNARAQQLNEKPEGIDTSDSNHSRTRNKSGNDSARNRRIRSSERHEVAVTERVRIRALSEILGQLRPIMGFFDENTSLCFHASSLLIVYEGDRQAPNPDVTGIKMIDFGRVRRNPGGDPGYKHGLQTLENFMDNILREEKQWLAAQEPKYSE